MKSIVVCIALLSTFVSAGEIKSNSNSGAISSGNGNITCPEKADCQAKNKKGVEGAVYDTYPTTTSSSAVKPCGSIVVCNTKR